MGDPGAAFHSKNPSRARPPADYYGFEASLLEKTELCGKNNDSVSQNTLATVQVEWRCP